MSHEYEIDIPSDQPTIPKAHRPDDWLDHDSFVEALAGAGEGHADDLGLGDSQPGRLGENERIRALLERVRDLENKIARAPCLVARDGETTYECRADNLCRVCRWRNEP